MTVTEISSVEASIGPARQPANPMGRLGVMCRANARSTPSSTPSSIIIGAPPAPSSPGWNINLTRPANRSRISDRSRAAPTSIAVWASWPQAWARPCSTEQKSSPLSSVMGRASVSARSRTVAGWPLPSPSRSATTEVRPSPARTARGRPSRASMIRRWVLGLSRPSSGWR